MEKINYPSVGINFSNTPSLKEAEYAMMLNGYIATVNGVYASVINEQSNLLCTNFKEGFKVVGVAYESALNTTFFALVNPITGESEIGYVLNAVNRDKYDKIIGCKSCGDAVVDEDTPLEKLTQVPTCEYHTWVFAPCLSFDINYPVSMWIKVDDVSTRIYFNDYKNDLRYIDYPEFQKIVQGLCPHISSDVLDCDKIKVFPQTDYPKLEVVDIVSGGQHKAGVVQYAICYADSLSNKVTDYWYVTNPVPLASKVILDNGEKAYPVSKSVKISAYDLNTDFKFINLVRLDTVGGVTTPVLIGTFQVNGTVFTYVDSGNQQMVTQNLSLDDVIGKRAFYTGAKGVTGSSGYVFNFNLKEQRNYNLQPVFSKLSPKFQSVSLEEGAYANPVIANRYVGYMGGEVYPLGISAILDNGQHTAVFPLVGREKVSSDDDIISNNDVIPGSLCSDEAQNKRWQVYNTASQPTNSICAPPSTSPPAQRQNIIDCVSTEMLVDSSVSPMKFYVVPQDVYPPNENNVSQYNSFISNPANLINNAEFSNPSSSLGFCNCDDIAASYLATGAQNVIATQGVIDLTQLTPAIEIVSEAQSITVDDWTSGVNNIAVPNPWGYQASPSPCDIKNTLNGDVNDDVDAFVNTRQNVSVQTAATIISVPQTSLAPQAWTEGSWLNTDSSRFDQWFTFQFPDGDGVAYLQMSTGVNNSSSVNAWKYREWEYEVYIKNADGTIGASISGVQSGLSGNAQYLLNKYTNLLIANNTQFYLRMNGTVYRNQGFVQTVGVKPDCKKVTFHLAVLKPTAQVKHTTNVLPKVVVHRNCTIDYFGSELSQCDGSPYVNGEFAYWESEATYPCNPEVWGDLSGKPIRHFKFPDSTTGAPHFKSNAGNPSLVSNTILPKGWIIDVEEIKHALNQAVVQGLITNEERLGIVGYRLYRGNRRGQESILGKGILNDVWKYKDNKFGTTNDVLSGAFPFNSTDDNSYISTLPVDRKARLNGNDWAHPTPDKSNTMYTFESPSTSFNDPALGNELCLEGELRGAANISFPKLDSNSVYQYPGAGVIQAALGFATIEASMEAIRTMTQTTNAANVMVFGSSFPLAVLLASISENLISPIRVYSHYAEWLDIIMKFAPQRNYGRFLQGIGRHTGIVDGAVGAGNTRRQVINSTYLRPTNTMIKAGTGVMRYNNYNRDSTVFLELGNSFTPTNGKDNTTFLPNIAWSAQQKTIANYYGAIKTFAPSQYGNIENIEWIDTGYNGVIDWDNIQDTKCDTIFGGDTFINRFSKKRKVPLFLDDRVTVYGQPAVSSVNSDIQMSLLGNIGYPRYFMDYPINYDFNSSGQQLFGAVAVQTDNHLDFNFINKSSTGQMWYGLGVGSAVLGAFAGAAVTVIGLGITAGVAMGVVQSQMGNDVFLDGGYIHSAYGLLDFLVESEYNLDLRVGTNQREGNFYPNTPDNWMQQNYVAISNDNVYEYNSDYSKQNRENPNQILPIAFNQVQDDKRQINSNRIIYSLQDNDQSSLYDGNLVYLVNNKIDLPKNRGALRIVKGLDSGKVLVVQENGASVFNAFISQETNIGLSTVGTNTLFNAGIPTLSIETDLGFGGSQTTAIANSEYGTFWCDNKRGQVILMTDGIKNVVEPEADWWFKQHLPFKILEDFPDYDITNNFKYVGASAVWDARYRRFLYTKRDLRLKPEYRGSKMVDGRFQTPNGEWFDETSKKHFWDVSWTISWSPLYQKFVSFYTFTPNFYVANQNYFSSGLNFSRDESQEGYWNHLLTNKSYQVFYGVRQPFLFDYSVGTDAHNKVLNSISYFSEYRRFQDTISSAIIKGKTFDKSIIYNQNQTSGYLNLVAFDRNDRTMLRLNGNVTADGTTALVANVENEWNFNYFCNVGNENGLPVMEFKHDNPVYLTPTKFLDYNRRFKDLLRSDYFVVRLENSKESNYQITTRFTIANITNSIT